MSGTHGYRPAALDHRRFLRAAALMGMGGLLPKGGSGKWGPIIMPPFPAVTDAETKALADWILSRK